MAHVDFYILKQPQAQARITFACRLAAKAFDAGHSVFVHTASVQDARAFDKALWSFNDQSFVPHYVSQDTGSTAKLNGIPPVVIGCGETPEAMDVTINLSDLPVESLSDTQRLLEIVTADATAREQSRACFKYYREQGCTLNTHNM